MPQKFTVTFSDRTYKVLSALGKQLDVPMADVLREAIALMWRATEALAEGNKVMIKSEDELVELSLPSLEQVRAIWMLEGQERSPRRDESASRPAKDHVAAAPAGPRTAGHVDQPAEGVESPPTGSTEELLAQLEKARRGRACR